MRDLRSALTALMLVTVLVGCSGGTPSTATGGSTSATTSSSEAAVDAEQAEPEPPDPGQVIPDGSYGKTATVAEAKALGITDRGFLDHFGRDGKDTYVFKVAGDRYSLFVGEEVPELGDIGTLAYDAQDNVAMTSASESCPGCVYTYDWSLTGDELSLKIVGHESTDSPEWVVIARFVTEGAFARQP